MKVLIIDDDPIVGGSLKTILGAQEDINVTGLGLNGTEALQLFQDTRPDILLMDIQMPELDGLSAAEKILTLDSHAKIVFLTTFPDDEYIVRALNLSAPAVTLSSRMSLPLLQPFVQLWQARAFSKEKWLNALHHMLQPNHMMKLFSVISLPESAKWSRLSRKGWTTQKSPLHFI